MGCSSLCKSSFRLQFRRLQLPRVYFETTQIFQILFVFISNSWKNPYFGKLIYLFIEDFIMIWSKSNMDIQVRRLIFSRAATKILASFYSSIHCTVYTFTWLFSISILFSYYKAFCLTNAIILFLTKRTKYKY